MNTDHFDRIVAMAKEAQQRKIMARYYIGDTDWINEGDAVVAALDDLAAMRQPITAEALKADGWKLRKTDDDIFPVDEFYRGGVIVRIGGGVVLVGVAGRRFDGVRTLYDLRELLRLVGNVA